ncbi:MAG: hypothetical protein HQ551_02400 [Desulfobacteraceae bacterium]|nr:hypothetical protein [Desulfobacteraceae bacterium]
MFLLADMMTWCEVGKALCHKAATYDGGEKCSISFIKAVARLFAVNVVEKVYLNSLKIVHGCDQTIDEVAEKLNDMNMALAMKDNLKDMDLVARELVK